MADKLPYVPTYGVITKALDKIKTAPAPERFTQDFLATKLGLKGGSAKPVIPYLKRIGFLGTDGAPTDRYKRFRNAANAGAAAAEALKQGYKVLYERNEYAHELNDKDLKGLIVEATGLEPESGTLRAIFGSFKALKAAAKFDAAEQGAAEEAAEAAEPAPAGAELAAPLKMGLSYTINLNLPATSDIAVFNAIFKSLRDHLLR